MNPLTQIKNTQKATRKEIEAGISDSASWHAKFKHSAYVFVGGLDYDLTEGDLLAVFAQYGEVVDLNLVRNQDTGKSKGFAFLAYEDQRSTVLSVDNLNGAKVAGRTIRVEHVDNYKKRKAELEDGAPPEGDQGKPGDAAPAGRTSMPPPTAPANGGDAASAGARGKQESSAPWAAPGSIFALLEEARQKERQNKSAKPKDGGEDRPRGRSDGAGPGPASGGFGPPRPPPRPSRDANRWDDGHGDRSDHHAQHGDHDRHQRDTQHHSSSRAGGQRDGHRDEPRADRPRDSDRAGSDGRRGYDHDRGGHERQYRDGGDAARGGGSQPPRHDRDAYARDGDGPGRSSRQERERRSPDRHKRRRSRSR